jgi:serine/threonine protein kinase
VTLKVVAGPIAGRAFSFDGHDTLLFGRSPDCHAELPEDDTTASRHHFLLEVNPPQARLRDLGSLNGTHVNGARHGGRARHERPEDAAGRPFPQVDLAHGDEIRVGRTVFAVEMDPPPAPSLETAPTSSRTPLAADHADSGRAFLEDLLHREGEGPPPEVPGYRVQRLLGRGGMGSVYLAEREGDARPVALKVMLAQVEVDELSRAAFHREIEITRSLEHPHIVRLLDHGSHGDCFYFAMEYCPGGSVEEVLRTHVTPMPVKTAGRLALLALEALSFAHARGFIHRDIKPENLLLADERARSVKVSDFGLAKSFEHAGLSGMTATGVVGGTFCFMPREQLTNFRQVRPAGDVWSMGATLYYMLTRQYARDFAPGQDPLQAILRGGTVPIRERDATLPRALAAVVDRAVADDLAHRYASASQFQEALASVL